jgi:hypothetical protein
MEINYRIGDIIQWETVRLILVTEKSTNVSGNGDPGFVGEEVILGPDGDTAMKVGSAWWGYDWQIVRVVRSAR